MSAPWNTWYKAPYRSVPLGTLGPSVPGTSGTVPGSGTVITQSLTWKAPVRVATAAALPAYTRVGNVLTANANGALPTIDGVTMAVGDRVMFVNGVAGSDNGIYTIVRLGSAGTTWAMERAIDADTSAKVVSEIATLVNEGTTNSGLLFRLLTANPITLNTTSLFFTGILQTQDPGNKPYDVVNMHTFKALVWKTPVRVATAAALPAYTRVTNTITENGNGALPSIDGVALIVGDRLLLKDGAAGADNGIYEVTSLGSAGTPFVLSRTIDLDDTADAISGIQVQPTEGTANVGIIFRLSTANPITLNTTALTFTGIPRGDTADGTVLTELVNVTARARISAWKNPVRACTVAAPAAYTRVGNVITANANGNLGPIDGIALVAGDRLLLKNGAAPADNGIYVVTQIGDAGTPFILTRANDANTSAAVVSGMRVAISEGTINAGFIYFLATANPITLNTTALAFSSIIEGQVTFTAVAAAEAGNARVVTLTLCDYAGVAVSRTQRFIAEIRDANFIVGLVGAWTATIGGGAAAVSTNTRSSVLADTTNGGSATVTVTDVSGAFAGTIFLVLTPVGQGTPGSVGAGPSQVIPLAFT